MRILNLLILVLAITFGFFSIALAAESVNTLQPKIYDIQITDAVTAILTLVFSVFLGAVSFVIAKSSKLFTKYLGVSIDDKTRQYLEVALQRGILYAENKVREKVIGGIKAPRTKDMRIALAADYVLSRVPDAIKHFKLDRSNLTAMIEARLSDSEKSEFSKAKKLGISNIKDVEETSDEETEAG